jgi:hypothetical protein
MRGHCSVYRIGALPAWQQHEPRLACALASSPAVLVAKQKQAWRGRDEYVCKKCIAAETQP